MTRRAIALASLVGLVAATVGIPVVQPVLRPGGKDLSQPFPCMHNVCGCQSAAACWRGCCCHSDREKLVWAEAHDVTPPEYVVAAAAKERSAAAVTHSCCSGAACDKPEANDIAQVDSAASEAWRLAFVPAVSARRCQGLPQLWMILSAALPASPRVVWRPEKPLVGPVPAATLLLISFDEPPATPPPRA